MNIVFDLGGVVFNWQPDAIIRSLFRDEDIQRKVRKQIFEHPDWVELDRGTIALERAIDRGAMRTGLPVQDVRRLLVAVPRFLTPIDETIELIRDLSETRNRLFVLSNMHLAFIEHLERSHDIWRLFDGVVISSRIRMVKPEPQIYAYLLTQHALEPRETIFIDDMPDNVVAASSMGIRTIRFLDSAQCRRALAHVW
jgi:putative hydrolase of the HAD superfamily